MKKTIAIIFIILSMLIWSTTFLVMKNTVDDVGAAFLIFFRAGITFILLLPFCLKKFKKFSKRDFKIVLLAGLAVSVGYITQAFGIKYTTPGKSAFLENSYCIIAPILACILQKTKMPRIDILNILFCAAGVCLISIDSIQGGINIGDILSVIAGLGYGVNITITGLYAKEINPLAYTCGQFGIVAILSGTCALIFNDIGTIAWTVPTLLRVLYLAVISTTVSWVLRNRAQQTLTPMTVSMILPFSSVIGTLLSVYMKADKLTPFFIMGAILILAAIFIDVFKNKLIKKDL